MPETVHLAEDQTKYENIIGFAWYLLPARASAFSFLIFGPMGIYISPLTIEFRQVVTPKLVPIAIDDAHTANGLNGVSCFDPEPAV